MLALSDLSSAESQVSDHSACNPIIERTAFVHHSLCHWLDLGSASDGNDGLAAEDRSRDTAAGTNTTPALRKSGIAG